MNQERSNHQAHNSNSPLPQTESGLIENDQFLKSEIDKLGKEKSKLIEELERLKPNLEVKNDVKSLESMDGTSLNSVKLLEVNIVLSNFFKCLATIIPKIFKDSPKSLKNKSTSRQINTPRVNSQTSIEMKKHVFIICRFWPFGQ